MSTSGSKSNEHVAHFLVDIHTGGTPEAHELLFLCSISIQSISIS